MYVYMYIDMYDHMHVDKRDGGSMLDLRALLVYILCMVEYVVY